MMMKWNNNNPKMCPISKHKSTVLKLGIMILATTLILHAFLSNNPGFPSYYYHSYTPLFFQRTHLISPVVFQPRDSVTDFADPYVKSPKRNGTCNIFAGEWIPNKAGPAYINETCEFIEEHQNCMKNGRPDSDYLYWKWRPKDCELPQFHAVRFLEMMRNKTWAFIGDSISRNHVQSLVCMLTKVEEAELFYHDEGWKSKGWRFPLYNLTIYVLWSPFLTEAATFEDINGVSTRDIELHLDRLDKKWADQYNNMDYMIFSTGKWFVKTAIYYENETILGCHRCQNHTELKLEVAYRKSLKLVLNFIATSGHKGIIFFKTSTPDHFEGGEWSSGGKCNRLNPFKEGEVQLKDLTKLLRKIELEEFAKAEAKASENGVNLKLLDVMQLSLLRPDGHPGPYREYYPFATDQNAQVQYDCLHWCLPGPIDTWNDLMMDIIVNS